MSTHLRNLLQPEVSPSVATRYQLGVEITGTGRNNRGWEMTLLGKNLLYKQEGLSLIPRNHEKSDPVAHTYHPSTLGDRDKRRTPGALMVEVLERDRDGEAAIIFATDSCLWLAFRSKTQADIEQ